MDDLVRSKLLAGVPRPAIAAAVTAGRVPLQEGCLRVLHRCAQENIAVSFLSVNPSRELLFAALHLDAWPGTNGTSDMQSQQEVHQKALPCFEGSCDLVGWLKFAVALDRSINRWIPSGGNRVSKHVVYLVLSVAPDSSNRLRDLNLDDAFDS